MSQARSFIGQFNASSHSGKGTAWNCQQITITRTYMKCSLFLDPGWDVGANNRGSGVRVGASNHLLILGSEFIYIC
jgi:hypothetical protein